MPAASFRKTIFASSKRSCTLSTSVGRLPVQLPHAGATTLIDALLNHLQITRLTRKMIEAYATIGQLPHALSASSIPEQQSHLEKYTYDRGLIDLLHDYPGVLLDPADLVAMLPKLAPRLYSISSSPLRARRRDPHHRRCRSLSLPQPRPRRRLFHPSRRSHSNRRTVCQSTSSPTRNFACPKTPMPPSS